MEKSEKPAQCGTRADRLDRFIKENRLIRRSFGDGKERACLLSALAPEVVGTGHPTANCPAELMPRWFAEVTPIIDDAGSEKKWKGVVTRYAELAHRWHILSQEEWGALEQRIWEQVLTPATAHRYGRDVDKRVGASLLNSRSPFADDKVIIDQKIDIVLDELEYAIMEAEEKIKLSNENDEKWSLYDNV